jgi:hypothetical protein
MGKIKKFMAQMHHSCTLSGRKQPEKLIRQHSPVTPLQL